jgi:2-desacetyl-2-hydroxyethyl bacteriochlorophyllide A dehydrogenase
MQNRKIVFTNVGKMEIVREELSGDKLAAREVLIETEYSLISPRTELACLEGSASEWFHYPRVPGYVTLGCILDTGADVHTVATGDYVIHNMGHQAYVRINVDEKLCVKVPEDLNHERAVFTKMATIAMASIRRSNIELGDPVVVTGLGLVGNFASQLAMLQGARVLALDIDEGRLAKAEECGIPCRVNDKATISDFVSSWSGGGGILTLIDATGIPSVVVDSLPFMAKHHGEVILLGSPWTECIRDLTEVFNYMHLASRGCITFKGAHAIVYPVHHDPFVKHSIERNSRIVMDLMREEKITVDCLITHMIKPEEAERAYKGLRDKKNSYLGVIVAWK